MADEVKVAVEPKVESTEKAPINPREAIENNVILENETVPDPIPDETVESKTVEKEEVKTQEVDEFVQLKQSVIDKRIGKEVAKTKSAEEKLAEAQAEIARLKSTKTEVVAEKKDDTPPTIEQVEAYIIKCREEGNVKEEIAAQRYLIKLEKESAIKEVEDRQKNQQSEAQKKSQAESQALIELAKDYISYDDKGQPDMKSDLTLANQKGKLFTTAMALYNDAELHSQYYNDPDRALGFRRAVQDANRELHAQGLIKTPKADGIVTRRLTQQLADPEAVETEEVVQSSSNLLSDAEKVREEVKSRNKMRFPRRVS